MDTTKDIRITFAERLLANLAQQIKAGFFGPAKKRADVAEALHEMGSLLSTLRYSYLDHAGLQQMAEQEGLRVYAEEVCGALVDAARDDPHKRALLRFYRRTLERLPLALGMEPQLESAVDVAVGRVSTTSRHPQAKSLILCRVDVFGEQLGIVTNLVKTRAGQLMKVALVPPADVMGVLSEAQFVGEATEAELALSPLPLGEHERHEIRKSAGGYLEG